MALIAQTPANGNIIVDALDGIARFFGDIGRAGHAASRFQHLASLNDRQLEELGCTREDAARAAFEESFGKL